MLSSRLRPAGGLGDFIKFVSKTEESGGPVVAPVESHRGTWKELVSAFR